jgi:hypothetical protein
MEQCFGAVRRQLEFDTIISSAAVRGRAVEVASCVLDQAGEGASAGASAGEGVENAKACCVSAAKWNTHDERGNQQSPRQWESDVRFH